MKKHLVFVALLFLAVGAGSALWAGPVQIVSDAISIEKGDRIEFDYTKFVGAYSGGGIFTYNVYTYNAGTSQWDLKGSIATFCLETPENVLLGQHPVDSVGINATGGGYDSSGNLISPNGADPISPQTAWLYSRFLEFLGGKLTAFNLAGGLVPDFQGAVGATDADKATSQKYWANALQVAIWFFEDEAFKDQNGNYILRYNNSNASGKLFAPYLDALIAAALAAGASGTGDVVAVNPVHSDTGAVLQSFLHQQTVVPEPAGLTLLGLGLLAVGALRRRA